MQWQQNDQQDEANLSCKGPLALQHTESDPVPGYSGTPLAQKLGIKAGHRIVLLGAPAGFETNLEGLPEEVILEMTLGAGPYDVMLLFVDDHDALARAFPKAARLLCPSGGLWVAWPKRAS